MPATSLAGMSTAFFRRLGPGSYRPTEAVKGAWRSDEQHVGPLLGLITHELQVHAPRPDLLTSRISHEILGTIAMDQTDIAVSTIRAGRTIELVEAVTTVAGRAVLRSRAWRLVRSDTTAVTGIEYPTMPGVRECEEYSVRQDWPSSVMDHLQFRAGPQGRPGRRGVWISTDVPLIEGEQVDALARYCALVDFANGVAIRRHPDEWTFPNVDLTMVLLRDPDPAWTGLDVSVSFGPDGVGVTSSVLHDVHGPLGQMAQTLTLRPR